MKRRRTRRHGFTLLEILLVLAILVILGGTVTIYFAKTQKKAYAKIAKVQIDVAATAFEEYHIEIGSYPTTQQGIGALSEAPTDANTSRWVGPYLSKPLPPDPWGRPYQYQSDGDTFHIWSWGIDGQDGTEDDISNI